MRKYEVTYKLAELELELSKALCDINVPELMQIDALDKVSLDLYMMRGKVSNMLRSLDQEWT